MTSYCKGKCSSLFTEVSFINMITEHIGAFFQFSHEFKNSVAAEIGLLFLWPFRDDHFHFLSIVELAAPQVLFQWYKLHLSVFCSKSEMVGL